MLNSNLEISIDKLQVPGIDFAKETVGQMKITLETNGLQTFFCEHVWYKKKISISGNSVFLKNLFNSNIVSIYDLLDANGNIYEKGSTG